MSVSNINVRVESEVKARAQDVFTSLGLDMTTAINAFLRQSIRQNGLPFALSNNPPRLTPKPGCMKGKIRISEDFDAPLEDFKEYME
jgi:DNA-damage-inducible protein J